MNEIAQGGRKHFQNPVPLIWKPCNVRDEVFFIQPNPLNATGAAPLK